MIRRFFRLALALSLVAFATAAPARAALAFDPAALYAQMKTAYDKAAASDWEFGEQKNYLSTILAAGRAYSLQLPDDPNYAQLATLTVQIGSSLHYNPLTNHDGAVWYVREAAQWTIQHSTDPTLVSEAKNLLERVDSEDQPATLAQQADADALANAAAYRADVEASLEIVEADWRAFILTGDPSWRALAFKRAASNDFPVAHLPTTYGAEFVRAAEASNDPNAVIVLARIRRLNAPLVIASVTSVPHDVYLSTLAPADEYFGKMGYSVIAMENELKRINTYLDYKYGNREANATVLVADAIDAMHKVYPRDRDMPKLLFSALATLRRMDDNDAKQAATHIRAILVVEYQDSPEARKELSGQ